ncbi:MAG: ATP-binding protein [Flavobacteriales bacterium]|nr:ATP-binding protein [Flavobacteriales bacterium]
MSRVAYISREIRNRVAHYMEIFPAIAILGPRQCGKSTLIKEMIKGLDEAIYLDLQNPDDAVKLAQPGLFFESNADRTICLDEIQLMPELFSLLRSVIDKDRRNGRFVLLGSASRDLQQSSETLAGRIGFINLTPFTAFELKSEPGYDLNTFWLRGGFPDSFLARTDEDSAIWREQFISTFIERDIPQLGFQIPALQLRRFITMCAHSHGQLINLSKLADSMAVSHPTIRKYIDLLEQTFILRTLEPFEVNVKKRLVKAPKVFVRDSGLLHQLLSIADFNGLLGHPIFGSSWEGMVIENILAHASGWKPYLFRTATGDELDLILEKGTMRIAVECKASTAPKFTKGFWRAIELVAPQMTYVVAPITGEGYALREDVRVVGLDEVLRII